MREAAKSYAKVEHDSTALPLEKSDIETVLAAADLDWSERSTRRSSGRCSSAVSIPARAPQLGARLPDRDKIMLLVEPVVIRPLLVGVERGEDRDRGGTGPCGSRQVRRRPDETAERGRAFRRAASSAVTARKPLEEFGISWTQQSGFNANQGQEIKWIWDVDAVRQRLQRLKWQYPQLHDLVQQHARSG